MELKAGSRLRSAVCDTEVIVVRVGDEPVTVECGGHPMLTSDDARPDGLAPAPGFDEPAPIGKRFTHPTVDLELLVTKGGAGSLSANGVLLPVKSAKPLPSSD